MCKRVSSYELRAASDRASQMRTTRASRLAPSAQPHRGILLLVVLSMLTLFLLIGTAFIVSSNQYRQANKIRAKLTEASNSSIDQQDLLNEVINQLVRDTNNPNSALRFHSLLRDMYGNDGATIGLGQSITFLTRNINDFDGFGLQDRTGRVFTINDTSNNKFALDLSMDAIGDQFFWVAVRFEDRTANSVALPLSLNDDYYNGRLFTFTKGELQGVTARVMRYTVLQDQAGSAFRYAIFTLMPLNADEPIRSQTLTTQANAATVDPWLRTEAVLNGLPFNGTGMGFNRLAAVGPKLNASETVLLNSGGATPLEIALMPNAASLYGIEQDNVYPYLDEFFLTQQELIYLNDNPEGLSTNQLLALKNRAFALRGPTGLGDSDESYDAADFQNMALGLLQPNPVETLLVGDAGSWPDAPNGWTLPLGLGNTVLPSFHRPALINYWKAQAGRLPTPALLHTEPNLLRKVMMRPSWFDHPNFTGSNPEWATISGRLAAQLALDGGNAVTDANSESARISNRLLQRSIYGPWDVDNDLDGHRDSVWVDIGLPVMENTDGRLVKPLAALLVLDMDGRLNLNAHGSEDIANADVINFNALDGALAGSADSDNLPHGQGYGPAEISLNPLMPGNNSTDRWAWYRRVFRGANPNESFDAVEADRLTPAVIGNGRRSFRRRIVGKYGRRPNPNAPDGASNRPLPGIDNVTVFDIAGQLKMQGVPPRAAVPNGDQSILRLGSYVTPPDFKGRYALGLDPLGRPVFESMLDAFRSNDRDAVIAIKSLQENTPYEINLSLGGSRGPSELAPDGPYTVAELERILRPYDADAGTLPPRIWEFAGEFKDNPNDTIPNLQQLNLWRTTVTTDSYDLPVPSVVVPKWMLLGLDGQPGKAQIDDDGNGQVDDAAEIGWPGTDDYAGVMDHAPTSATFADLLEYRIRAAQEAASGQVWRRSEDTPARLATVQQELRRLLPQDLADGLRLDINRPLGNGRDDDGNRVVDEPGEREDPYWASTDPRLNAFTGGTGYFRDDQMFLSDVIRDNDPSNDADELENYKNRLGITNQVDSRAERVIAHNLRRQMLARDLYIMAMTLVDPLPNDASDNDRRARARRLAQWAINIVDFRDPDNIMTGFEYDANPFDGWAADQNLETTDDRLTGNNLLNGDNLYGADAAIGGLAGNADDGGVVWGSEGAELIMTETLSWHDRRTTDEGPEFEAATVGGGALEVTEEAGRVFDPAEPDRDFDQLYRPQGACFVELYCPLSPNPAANADTHLISNTGEDLGINLRAVDSVTGNSPVWRMAVYQRPRDLDALECADWDPDSPTVRERPSSDPNGAPGNEIEPDRCVYFARFADTEAARLQQLKNMDPNDGVEFFTELEVPPVRPGRYMVVGSGIEQNGNGRKSVGRPLNQRVYGMNIGDIDVTSGPGGSKQRRIELDPNDAMNPFRFFESSNTGSPQGDEETFKDENGVPICDVAVITNALSAMGPTALSRRFSVTEPARGYPGDDPTNFPPVGPSYVENIPGSPGQEGRYGNVAQPAAYDRPHDDVRTDGETRLQLLNNFEDNDELIIECFSMIYLQRLANPLLPYDKETNPYRTVDGMSTNVSLFNGIVGSPDRPAGESFQTDLQNGSPEGRVHFENRFAEPYLASVQRGYTVSENVGADYESSVMGFEPPNFSLDPANRVNGFQPPRRNQYPPAGTPVKHAINAIPDMTLGRVNTAFQSAAVQNAYQRRRFSEPVLADPSNPDYYDGLTPEEPFAWLTWNNRPFANANELMLVPRSSSSQLLREFSGVANDINTFIADDVPKQPSGAAGAGAPAAVQNQNRFAYLQQQQQGYFGHLPNMQLAERPQDDKLPDVPAGFHRVLEYVHVSSPFVGSETWLNPAAFGDATTAMTSTNDPRYGLQPPFNKVSAYREPGRINVNTVASAHVWDGGVLHRELLDPTQPYDPLNSDPSLRNNYLQSWTVNDGLGNPQIIYGHTGPLFVDLSNDTDGNPVNGLLENRRGYAILTGPNTPNPVLDNSLLPLDSRMPTFFANPFRSSEAGDLVPLANLQRPSSECTMFRRRAFNPGFDGQWGVAGQADGTGNTIVDDLEDFGKNTNADDIEDELPLMGGNSDAEFNDGARHAYFGFQPMTRLSSMTTNRSNVYAVWVTIGFFEVQEAPDINTFQATNDPGGILTGPQLAALYERVYPEGYQFGKEAGSDTGDIRRVREFAVIDRTIPVAFEPGENHNVDKAIRLRTRIE